LKNNHQVSSHFIIGMGRSGTTLLLSMLNSVETNVCVPEIPIALYLYNSHRNRREFNVNDVRQILSLRTKLKYIRNVNVKDSYFVDNVINCKNYKDFIQVASLSTSDNSKKIQLIENIIDKNPIYTFYTDALSSIFPEPKFLIMTRNPFGYVNSCIESIDPGKKARSAEFYSLAYDIYAKEIEKIQKKYFNRALVVQYEDLVENPESTMKNICNFLSIDFKLEMLEFYKKTFNLDHKKEGLNDSQKTRIQFKYQALSKPVNTSRIESWKNKLSKKQINIISSITSNEAKKFGYDISYHQKNYSINYLKSVLYIQIYFMFARKFYHLPIWLREIFRVKV